ncbi:MAG: T9SS type A sorting domain-containing protein [Bacteroidales bacterium]|nr:T9SS type A sorting domain-containing protein [Bacteroidales bacterium]
MKTTKLLKHFLVLTCIAISGIHAQSQIVTSTSGYQPSDTYYESLPIMTLSPQSASVVLPNEVDNSTKPYYPQKDNSTSVYVFDQYPGASCQSVSSIWSTFTYEINRLRNLTSNQQTTRYAPFFSYNHLNHGFNNWEGYTQLEIVHSFLKQSGAMTDFEFDGPQNYDTYDAWRWPSGYELYYNAMKNKLESVYKFDMSIPKDYSGDPAVEFKLEQNLQLMKIYLYDHNENTPNNGGIITYGVTCESGTVLLKYPSAHINENVMYETNYEAGGGHAMAIVGYCEDVQFDWGGAVGADGKITGDGICRNNYDNNLDGIYDMQDWEVGAVKVYNSYGLDYDHDGYRWMLYSTLPLITTSYPIGPYWGNHEFCALKPKMVNEPQVVLKVEIEARYRNDLKLGCGSAPLANYGTYSESSPNYYTGYINDGGDNYIQGKDASGNDLVDPIKLLFDYSYFYPNNDYGKVFLINEKNTTNDGKINSLSLVDYRWGEEFELPYEGVTPFSIGSPLAAGIEYDLIVQGPLAPEIDQNTTFEANMVSRFNPTVSNNTTLTVNPGVRIDMYNSTITCNPGSTLQLGDNVIFRARRGTNKILIYGTIQAGLNIKFESNPGATLEVIYANASYEALLNQCVFENTNLTIQAGTLTVQNSTFYLGEENKVIVKQASKLNLGNSLLTKSGIGQWRGIEVWGTSSCHQFSINGLVEQGSIELLNGSVIEYAYNGITNWEPNNYDAIGGIIKANGTAFRNNRRAIEFVKYRNFNPISGQEMDNISSFTNCTFEINDDYLSNAAPYYSQVSMWHVKGIKFAGCDFVNSRTNNISGYAIHSIDAGYHISAICMSNIIPCPQADLDKTYIKGFQYGVHASNSETSYTVDVENCKFSNNGYGVLLQAVNNVSVVKNKFEIGTALDCSNWGYGIVMNGCSGYAIEDNTFVKVNSTPNASFSGIEIVNSGPSYNEIYRNTFQGVTVSSLADLQNSSIPAHTLPPTGLTFLCNTNIENKYDFYVTNKKETTISPYQKSGSLAAGNSFSSNANINFDNGGGSKVFYCYAPGQDPFTYYGLQLIPTTNINSCPSHYGSSEMNNIILNSNVLIQKEQEFATGFSAYNNVKAVYQTLVDGGSTANTIDEIQTTASTNMWELRNDLLGRSPHLSQEALREAAIKTDVLPESVLFEILAANPDEMRDEKFLDFLKSKDIPLPEYMIELLREIAGNTSYKTIMQEQLNHYDYQKTVAANDILRSKLNDDEIDQSGILNWLDNKADLYSRYEMIDTWIQCGNTSAAMSLLSQIPELYSLSETEIIDYQNFSNIKSLQIAMKNSSRNIMQINSEEIEVLSAIAATNLGIASGQAKGILEYAVGVNYCHCTPLDDALKHSFVVPSNHSYQQEKIEVKLSPNPATTWLAFDYILPEKVSSIEIEITDGQGRLIDKISLAGKHGQRILDTRSYTPGIYFYKTSKHQNVAGKFIVK